MRVKIKTYSVGQCFACAAKVIAISNGRKLMETRDLPYGFEASAYRIAEQWAENNGHTVINDIQEFVDGLIQNAETRAMLKEVMKL
jgi:hypothetical protein